MPTRHSRTRLRLEPLESRRTPATLAASAKSITFTDTDGDTAVVSFAKPVLTTANVNTIFKFDVGSVDGSNVLNQQLLEIDLTQLPKGQSVSVSALDSGGGDHKVNVGWIKADGLDEGDIGVSGDLGRITVGDADPKSTALQLLLAGSIGVQGVATQPSGGTLASVVNGPVGNLIVTNDILGASITVNGEANGKIGNLIVFGSVKSDPLLPNTGYIKTEGAIKFLLIQKDLVGGAGDNSGAISAASLGETNVTGQVTGGTGAASGSINSVTGIKKLVITGALTGSDGIQSGSVTANDGNIGDVVVGSIAGGAGKFSGTIRALVNGPAKGGRIKEVSMIGDVAGGSGGTSGVIFAADKMGKVSIANVIGNGPDSGTIGAGKGGLGPVTLVSLQGGANDGSGAIFSAGPIKSVLMLGSMIGGGGTNSGSITANGGKLGRVEVLGNVLGGSGQGSAQIRSIQAQVGTTSKFVGGQITTVLIAGNVTGGSGLGSASIVADQSIGKVVVGGNWTGASIAAGVDPGADGYFGTADDTRRVAKIAGITIAGTVDGTAASGDAFAFVAAQISAFSANNTKAVLKGGPANDTMPLGTQGDFQLLEVGL